MITVYSKKAKKKFFVCGKISIFISSFIIQSKMPGLIYKNIARALSFTEKDLAANKRLSLTEKQKHRLRPKLEIHVTLSFLLTTLFFFAAFGLLTFGFNSSTALFLTFVSLLGFGLSIYWAFRSVQKANLLKSYSGVKFIEGIAEFKVINLPDSFNSDKDAKIPVYTMKVGKTRIYLDEAAFYLMSAGEYRVYYFEAVRKIVLSLEKIE